MSRVNREQRAKKLIVRLWNTAVLWTWLFNGMRLASGLLLLPLLLRLLSQADLGMHGQFLALSAFLLTFDQIFSVTIARHVGYALRGVADIQAAGVPAAGEGGGAPNPVLLGQLLAVTKQLYRWMSGAILVLLGIGGTLVIYPLVPETTYPNVTWAAWAVMVAGAVLELYTGYWLAYLRGLNQVLLTARLSTFIYGVKLALSAALLIAGFTLLAVPIASLATGLLQRFLARRFTRENLPAGVRPDPSRNRALIRMIWPNAWRLGAILLSINIMIAGLGLMISHQWSLAISARYWFSHQILCVICLNMAGVWTLVKWPYICQLRATNDLAAMRRVIWPRLWLQTATFVALAAGFIWLGPALVKWVAPDKHLLEPRWLVLMAVYAFLEMKYIFWTTVISTDNRIPSLWAAVWTNVATLLLAAALAYGTNLGIGAFVIAPLVCGLALNYWYWPRQGAASLGATWWKFMFNRPA